MNYKRCSFKVFMLCHRHSIEPRYSMAKTELYIREKPLDPISPSEITEFTALPDFVTLRKSESIYFGQLSNSLRHGLG